MTDETGNTDPGELLQRLGALPARAPSAETSARLLRKPRAVFAREAARAESPFAAALARLYVRLEPAAVGVIVLVYLGWALRTSLGLLR